MLDVAGNLLALPIKLLDLVRGVKTLQREGADRISDLFRHISDALAAAAAEIRDGRVPHGVCGQLMAFAAELFETTKGVLGEDKARELADQLWANYNIESFAMRLDSADAAGRETAAQQLEESSGRFLALGHMIRAKA